MRNEDEAEVPETLEISNLVTGRVEVPLMERVWFRYVGVQACAVSPSKAEPTRVSGETNLEYRESDPERTQAIQISGGGSRASMEGQSYDALIQRDRTMHSDLGLAFVKVFS